MFALNGEYWSLSFGGSSLSLKDTKGLHYLQRLLQYPGKEFHVFELFSGPEGADRTVSESAVRVDPNLTVRELGDAGEILDSQAVRAYKNRVADLREELDEARERGDAARAESIQSEIDFIAREITRAL